jgi:hypothetical protein
MTNFTIFPLTNCLRLFAPQAFSDRDDAPHWPHRRVRKRDQPRSMSSTPRMAGSNKTTTCSASEFNVRFAPGAAPPNRSFRDIAVANDRLTESDFNLSKHRLNARDVAGGNRNSNSPARCGKTGGSPWTLAINGIGSNSMKRRYSTPFKCRFSLARSTLPCSARLSKISR